MPTAACAAAVRRDLGRERLYVGGDFTKVNWEHQPGFVIFPAGGVTQVANWSRSGHNPPPILQSVGNFRRYGEEILYNSERDPPEEGET